MTNQEWRRYKISYYAQLTACFFGMGGCLWLMGWLIWWSYQNPVCP